MSIDRFSTFSVCCIFNANLNNTYKNRTTLIVICIFNGQHVAQFSTDNMLRNQLQPLANGATFGPTWSCYLVACTCTYIVGFFLGGGVFEKIEDGPTSSSRAKCPIRSLSSRWEWANRTLGSQRWPNVSPKLMYNTTHINSDLLISKSSEVGWCQVRKIFYLYFILY